MRLCPPYVIARCDLDPSRHCEERKRRSNPSFVMRPDGLLRGVYHRAALRADLQAPSGLSASDYFPAVLLRAVSPARTKSTIWSSDGPGLLAALAIIFGWENRLIPRQVP